MINAILILLLYQLAGEVSVRALGLPLPGPVVGMLLLFATLLIRGKLPTTLQQTSQTILANLSLLFVPAGVGVMVHLDRIRADWLPLLIALLFGTWLSLALSAVTLQALLRWRGRQ
ncbi:MAG: CidA/LrgA family protein [Roseiflexaceae bacterium]